MNIYRNCDVLPLYNFKKLKEDVRWLVKGWDGYEDISTDYRKREKLRKMKLEYSTCSLIVNSYRNDMLLRHVESLSDCLCVFGSKYKINLLKNIDKQLLNIKKRLSSLKFNIDMMESEMTVDVNYKEIDVFQEVSNLEKATERSEINPFTTTVSRYIAILKEAKSNVARNRNNGR